MKLEKFIKFIDPLSRVTIWSADDFRDAEISNEDPEPIYDGYFMNMPWYLLDYKIGRPAGDTEPPMYVSYITHKKDKDIKEGVLVINVLPPDWED